MKVCNCANGCNSWTAEQWHSLQENVQVCKVSKTGGTVGQLSSGTVCMIVFKCTKCAKRQEKLNSWAVVAQFARKWKSVPKCANIIYTFTHLRTLDTCTHFSTLSQTLALILSTCWKHNWFAVIAIPRKYFCILSVTVAHVILRRKKNCTQLSNIKPKIFINKSYLLNSVPKCVSVQDCVQIWVKNVCKSVECASVQKCVQV